MKKIKEEIMKTFDDYLEMSQSTIDIWWDKNYKKLINWVNDNHELAADLYANNLSNRGANEDEIDDAMGAFYDSTSKHQAQDIMYTMDLSTLEEIINEDVRQQLK